MKQNEQYELNLGNMKGAGGKLEWFTQFYIVLVLLCGFNFFDLFWWTHLSGLFNVSDIGILLIGVGVIFKFIREGAKPIFRTNITIYLSVYFVLLLLQVCQANLLYDYSLIRGFMAIREYGYYLFALYLLYAIDSPLKLQKLVSIMSVLGLIAIILAIINGYVIRIFIDAQAEGQGFRSGMERIHIPAITMITTVSILKVCDMIVAGRRLDVVAGIWALTFFVVILIRQTRMIIGGLFVAVTSLCILKGKIKLSILFFLLGLLVIWVIQLTSDVKFVEKTIELTVEEYHMTNNGTGSLGARVIQIQRDFKIFLEHPIFGTGAAAIRVDSNISALSSDNKLIKLGYKADLGYTSWLKSFGIVGMFWLVVLFIKLVRIGLKNYKSNNLIREQLGMYVIGNTGYLFISFLTLNHFMYKGGIIMIAVLLSIAGLLEKGWKENSPSCVDDLQFQRTPLEINNDKIKYFQN